MEVAFQPDVDQERGVHQWGHVIFKLSYNQIDQLKTTNHT